MVPIGEKDWVPVTGPMYLREAEVISGLLEETGIPVKLATPNGQRFRAFAPQLDTAQVLVPKEHLGRAQAFLEAKGREAEGK